MAGCVVTGRVLTRRVPTGRVLTASIRARVAAAFALVVVAVLSQYGDELARAIEQATPRTPVAGRPIAAEGNLPLRAPDAGDYLSITGW